MMTKVLKILKRRIYYGKAHDTKLSDLKIVEKEILDWADKLLEEQAKYLATKDRADIGGGE